MALSALLSKAPSSEAGAFANAKPMLAVTGCSSFTRRLAIRARRRSATSIAVSGGVLGSRMANSSPPSLPAMSLSRRLALIAAPMRCSTWSPAACPNVSLICLKWSTSSINTAMNVPASLHWACCAEALSKKARRLFRPVSSSVHEATMASRCARCISCFRRQAVVNAEDRLRVALTTNQANTNTAKAIPCCSVEGCSSSQPVEGSKTRPIDTRVMLR
ncbi:hypothetical protein D3C80_1322070 [compost metagenome]